MPKIVRVNQKQFGQSGPLGDFGVFGSKKNQPQTFTQDPDAMQSLNAFLNGLGDCIVGNYEPPLEDINSLFFLNFRQLAYLFQQGVAEWVSTCTYYIGSMINLNGVTYVSITNNNTGNTPGVSTSTFWQAIGMVKGTDIVSATSITPSSDGTIFNVTGSTDIATINNPNAIPEIKLIFTTVLNVINAGNILLNNGNFQTSVNATLHLAWNGVKWVEVARSPASTFDVAQHISVLTGTVSHGGAIPLPSGYTEAQCKWFVSLRSWFITGDQHATWYSNANINADNRTSVSVDNGGANGGLNPATGVGNYIIIGIK